MLIATKKTGQDVANLIMSELEKNSIPLMDCRGQGYDNYANMAGVYNGAQAIYNLTEQSCLLRQLCRSQS